MRQRFITVAAGACRLLTETGLDEESPVWTLHLAGASGCTAERTRPALTELSGHGGRGFALRTAFGDSEEVLEGLAAGHHGPAISTARP